MKTGSKKYAVYVIALLLVVAAVALALPLLSSSTVTIAYSEKVNYETLIIANEKGLLAEQGFNTKLVTGGIQAAEALITGSVDMAVMGDGPAVQVITKNSGAKIVARFTGGEGIHRFIATTDIIEPQDIEGKKVGLQGSSSTHAAFLRWAKAYDVDMKKVIITFLSPTDIPWAMKNGEIQVMAGSEPWALNTEKLCGSLVHEIGNSSGLGSTHPIVLVASAKIIRDNPDAVASMIDILQRSNEFINENWSEAMQICANRTGLSASDQEKCSAMQFFNVGFNETDSASIDVAAEAMLVFGSITTLPTVMDHVDLRFLSNL